MATIREYYEKDFSNTLRVFVRFPFGSEMIEGSIQYDFVGYSGFVACYVQGKNRTKDYFVEYLTSLQYGKSQIILDKNITLPTASVHPGKLTIKNAENFEILSQFFGDPEWISSKNIQLSKRIFIYSETDLNADEIRDLKSKAKELGHELQFYSDVFVTERSQFEKPLAFISHDSRDKDLIAKKIALGLQKMLCPVWYDEFTLKVGDNLRDSIEKGLRECKKCILILSPNFIANSGWTKVEFDSIFTRQIIEEQKLVLPIWYNVSKTDVYNYSPSLALIKALDWDKVGEAEVCRQLYGATMTNARVGTVG